MAYKVKCIEKCNEQYCDKKADWEVRGRLNQSYGKFCRKHADQKIRDIEIAEHYVEIGEKK